MGEIDYYLMGLGCLFIGAGFFFLLDKPKELSMSESKFKVGDRVAAYDSSISGALTNPHRKTGTIEKYNPESNTFGISLDSDKRDIKTIYSFTQQQLRKLVKKVK